MRAWVSSSLANASLKLPAAAKNSGQRCQETWLYWLKGTLLLHIEHIAKAIATPKQDTKLTTRASNARRAAEACFQKAIDFARQKRAKWLELQAVMSLSRLWQQQGKQREARQRLIETYGWFTEGYDTKGLQEAKTLLHELA